MFVCVCVCVCARAHARVCGALCIGKSPGKSRARIGLKDKILIIILLSSIMYTYMYS